MFLKLNSLTRFLNPTLENVTKRLIHLTPIIANKCGGGSKQKCTMIPGDGVGPELMGSVIEVFDAMSIPIEFECFNISEMVKGAAKLEDAVASIKKNKMCLKGPVIAKLFEGHAESRNINMDFRSALDLFANVSHVRTAPGLKLRHKDINLVVIREMLEGEYTGLEHTAVKGVTETLKITTEKRTSRLARFAFKYATEHKRKKVTIIHKANIMKMTDGLFLKVCTDVSKKFSAIKCDKMIVDNCTMQIVSKPHQFDVMITPNLYGCIINNICAGLVGGVGVLPSTTVSPDGIMVFEPGARHAALEDANKNVANPTAMLMCGALLLKHLKMNDKGDCIFKALERVLCDGKVRTRDMGGCSSTSEFTKAVIASLK